MKRIQFKILVSILSTLFAATTLQAQGGYAINFKSQSMADGKYYIGQHFRDEFRVLDSATASQGSLNFSGKHKIDKGVYVLMKNRKTSMFDFMIDDSRTFTITFDEKYTNAGMKVKGSKANELMYQYMAKQDWGREQAKEYKNDKEKMDALSKEMVSFEENYLKNNQQYLFSKLISMFGNVDIPDQIPAGSRDTNLREWQACYYRTHYWDNVDLKDHSLIYTPHLFNKMNMFFYGPMLYYQDADTITKYVEMLFDKVVDDSTMLRYFMDFALPRYERSTKNIGWDQVFVNLVNDYYLKGKCPWATKAELYNKQQTVQFLSQSLIGAMGQELIMADTNQSEDPKDWISSHALPQKYVMLWFWDPDCNHCKKQTAELITLYDSLTRAGNKIFEVYAVGYESDVAKWKGYVRKHKLPFINVGGPNVNIDYQEAYNVHGAPTMIILNADRQIIMNKTLATKNVLPFIEQYEKKHPEQAHRGPSKWQLEGIRRAKVGN